MQLNLFGTPEELTEFVSKQRACVDEDKIKKLEEITDNYVKTMCNPHPCYDFGRRLDEYSLRDGFNATVKDCSTGGDDDANEDVHEDVHEDEKEVSDEDKFIAELQQLLDKYPQFKNIEFKAGALTIDSSE